MENDNNITQYRILNIGTFNGILKTIIEKDSFSNIIYKIININTNKTLIFKIKHTGEVYFVDNSDKLDIEHFLNCALSKLPKDISGSLNNDIDYGLNDPILFAILILSINTNKLKIMNYFCNGYLSADYFDTIEPNKQQFLEFLNLQDKTEGMAIVPVTVKDHYSTLFIDLKDKKMLCLFDSGLPHTDGKGIEEKRRLCDKLYEELEEAEEIEEIEKIKEVQNKIRLNKIQFIVDPCASKYVFGENLAKDIICLNDYCLQDEQSCGYWTIAACELGASEEYGTLDRIQEDCESGIFQIKLAKRVFEITDDIIKGKKQNIILINPSTASFNKQDYIEYTKDSYTIFIKNIETSTVIGVDLNLLQRQMLSKGFIKYQQKADIIQQQAISSNLTDSIVELSNFTIKETSLSKNYPSQ